MIYSSWPIDIEVKMVNNGFMLTTETVRGKDEYIARNEEEIKKILIKTCKDNKFSSENLTKILKYFNIDFHFLETIID